ncbi:MAG: sodium:proton antiporter [Bifidobacterium tibiigranuli]|jgi:CPA1 family monovalent cation:H+ antiporter|uniref:cation:proton antiporter n=1 Tax=Bifidobacterium tibiigranuli TaxID=2172043 RepID=UPI0023571F4F|nr:sodium:proton antiporter [Bifidobacterium tibiigranuli]MCH3974342.1 sodium:proton antiporter [Bifidobacterium tibiigranuli]MCH4188905.1 sodium:proton antiporter [Bifidobacterium tibiigranuli]MCH4203190.1 sodium:proton antiporter [Bifidobacterium tibiigranuli]MCH4273423.1 sodium:proton antiporter [Bifidobacterium tibiigranuli]MCI1232256.1 sodium:proton antiporter [Bifidobacterium tibiigranuli]
MTTLLLAIIAVLVVTAAADLFSDKIRIAAPILLLVLGAGVALIPNMPAIEAMPEFVLTVILPPLLYSSAVNMSVSEFRRNLLPIGVLAIVLVALSSAAIGFAVNLMAPGVGIAACIALGAIVSPTDAVATAIVKKAGVSQRVVTILEGEGLVNDATALVILSSAVGAMTSRISAGHVVLDFVIAVVGAVVIGWLVGRVMIWLRSKINSATPDTVLSLATPFVAFLPAEYLHSSGLVAAVIAGLVASHRGPRLLTPTQRMSSKTTWDSLMMILESSVFLLMGLELTSVVGDLEGDSFGWRLALGVAAITLVLTLILRAAVTMPLLSVLARWSGRRARFKSRLQHASEKFGAALDLESALSQQESQQTNATHQGRRERFQRRLTRLVSDLDYHTDHPLGSREGSVMVWAGMRGSITLAAAQTLPLGTAHRSFLIFVAFLVAAASLLIQGTTLNQVVRLVKPARTVGVSRDEHDAIRQLIRHAARAVHPPEAICNLLVKFNIDVTNKDADRDHIRRAAMTLARQQFEAMRNYSGGDDDDADSGPGQFPLGSMQDRRRLAEISYDYALDIIIAQRTALLDANDAGLFSPEGIGEALDILDADQLSLETRAISLN